MSWKAEAWAKEQQVPALEKWVLVALADRHNIDTGQCFPSIDRIAYDCGMSASCVKEKLRALEQRGLVTRIARRNGPVSMSNSYQLHFDVLIAGEPFRGRAPEDAGWTKREEGGGVATRPTRVQSISAPGAERPTGGATQPRVGRHAPPNLLLNLEINTIPPYAPQGGPQVAADAVALPKPETLVELRKVLAAPDAPAVAEEPRACEGLLVRDAVEAKAEALWRKLQPGLAARVKPGVYATWLKPLRGVELDGAVLVVGLPSESFAHVPGRYASDVAVALASADLRGVERVEFRVALREMPAPPAAPFVDRYRERDARGRVRRPRNAA